MSRDVVLIKAAGPDLRDGAGTAIRSRNGPAAGKDEERIYHDPQTKERHK